MCGKAGRMTGSPAVLVLVAEADAVRSRLKGGNAMRSMRPPARAEPLVLCDCDSAWPSKSLRPSLPICPSTFFLTAHPLFLFPTLPLFASSRRTRNSVESRPSSILASIASRERTAATLVTSQARPTQQQPSIPALACSPSDKVAADSIPGRGVLSSLLSDDDVACRCPP
ncbi:hypothetical protein EDB80DRAFT_374637 [Ilyonectria destructans]|nr:hypothetical protein EDB80DRAFT_374637 [Ilyonectria destructans]